MIGRLWLEIGFGRGEHMAAQAAANRQVGIIGAEPFLDGVVGALLEIDSRGLTNIRLHNGDALDILDRLPDASLDRVFLLHPDPWPKFRHAKRRFVNPGPLAHAGAGAQTRRRIPARHRSPDLLPLGAGADAGNPRL